MGTRSLTKVIERCEDFQTKKKIASTICKEEVLTTMYRQYDGYLSGHGYELAEWLDEFTMVNGIGLDEKRKIANGASCLAAQMFAHFKDGPGGIYLYSPDVTNVGEEYIYKIYVGAEILLKVYNTYEGSDPTFEGTPAEFLEMAETEQYA